MALPGRNPDGSTMSLADEIAAHLDRQRYGDPFWGPQPIAPIFGGWGAHDDPTDFGGLGPDAEPAILEPIDLQPRPEMGRYTVHKGDSLEPIARAHYGDDWRAGMIAMMQANGIRLLSNGSPLIHPNQTLLVPPLDGDVTAMNRAGGQVIAANTAAIERARQRAMYEAALRDAEVHRGGGETGDWSAQPQTRMDHVLEWLNHNEAVRRAAGQAALIGGAGVGVVNGAVDTVKGFADAAGFIGGLIGPHRAEHWRDAVNGVSDAVHHAGDYVQHGIHHPGEVLRDVENGARRLAVAYIPSASPMAETATGEAGRMFGIGRNDGKLLFDVGSTLAGGVLLKGAGGMGALSRLRALGVTKAGRAVDVAAGMKPGWAEHLAETYPGMGHHFIPRRVAKRLYIPDVITNSPWNVLKPNDLDRGLMYQLHYGVDPRFYGARGPAELGRGRGSGWSGKRLGLNRFDLAGQLWYGSPDLLKQTIGTPVMVGDIGNFANGDDQ